MKQQLPNCHNHLRRQRGLIPNTIFRQLNVYASIYQLGSQKEIHVFYARETEQKKAPKKEEENLVLNQ